MHERFWIKLLFDKNIKLIFCSLSHYSECRCGFCYLWPVCSGTARSSCFICSTSNRSISWAHNRPISSKKLWTKTAWASAMVGSTRSLCCLYFVCRPFQYFQLLINSTVSVHSIVPNSGNELWMMDRYQRSKTVNSITYKLWWKTQFCTVRAVLGINS